MDTFLTEGKYHFFFGDKTAIPLFDKARKKICHPEKIYIGVLVLEDYEKDIPEQLGLLVDVIPRKGDGCQQAIHFLQTLDPEIWNLWKQGIFHLMGGIDIVYPFRSELTKMGIPDQRIRTYRLSPVKRPDLAVKFPFSGL